MTEPVRPLADTIERPRGLVVYPCPLDGVTWAELRLPNPLTMRDCDRIIAFVQTLVPNQEIHD